MDAAPIAEGPQWVDQFLEEFPIEDCDPVDKTIAETLKHYLLSNGKITAAETARQIDRCFQHDWLNGVPDHPEDFIQDFYDIVFCLAKVVPHNDPKQDRLIQVILELRKLPAKQFQIWEEDSLVWTQEPVFEERMEERWSRTVAPGLKDGLSDPSLQEQCSRYVNFSSFLARNLEAGLLDPLGDGRYKYAEAGCHDGLEVAVANKQRRDCEVMVAVQYILLAGHALAEDWVTKPAFDRAPDQWTRWAEKLREISRQEDEYGHLAPLAKEAYDRMLSLTPEMLSSSDDAQTDAAAPADEAKEAEDAVSSVGNGIDHLRLGGTEAVEEGKADASQGVSKWWKTIRDAFKKSG